MRGSFDVFAMSLSLILFVESIMYLVLGRLEELGLIELTFSFDPAKRMILELNTVVSLFTPLIASLIIYHYRRKNGDV